jgi:hypothetical protein
MTLKSAFSLTAFLLIITLSRTVSEKALFKVFLPNLY